MRPRVTLAALTFLFASPVGATIIAVHGNTFTTGGVPSGGCM